MNRAKDWLEESKNDLKFAEICLQAKQYNWGCFVSQQAAEKAIKALYLSINPEDCGEALTKLLEELKSEIELEDNLIEKAKKLDQYYIPTRYPNSFVAGKPSDYYTEKDLSEAIDYAKNIIKFCENKISSI